MTTEQQGLPLEDVPPARERERTAPETPEPAAPPTRERDNDQSLLPVEDMVELQVGYIVELGFCRNIRVPASMVGQMPKEAEELAAVVGGTYKVKGFTYETTDEVELIYDNVVSATVHDMDGTPVPVPLGYFLEVSGEQHGDDLQVREVPPGEGLAGDAPDAEVDDAE